MAPLPPSKKQKARPAKRQGASSVRHTRAIQRDRTKRPLAAPLSGPVAQGLTALPFARPVSAKHWLQASNPSERWKWDVMFQDLPPVKGAVDPSAVPTPIGAVPLKEVK